MMKEYTVTITWYRDGKKVNHYRPWHNILLQEEEVKDMKVAVTWDNVEKIYYTLGGSSAPFILYERGIFDRDMILSFYDGSLFNKKTRWLTDIHKSKSEPLNMEYTVTYTESKYKMTLAEILKYDNRDKAIAYLRQLGLEIKL